MDRTVGHIVRYYEKEFEKRGLEKSVAKYLLSEVMNCFPEDIVFKLWLELSDETIEKFRTFCELYMSGVPASYVTNRRYFYMCELYVDERVLIPRQETEELVDFVIKKHNEDKLRVLDLCCGSGCIGLTIKKFRPQFDVYLSDINERCLEVARINQEILKVDATLLLGDLFEPIISNNIKFDVLVCNPPYIAKDDPYVDKMTLKEPHDALFTNDPKGLEFYEKIFNFLKDYDFKNAYFEIGFKQKADLIELLNGYPFNYKFYKDMSNNDRILEIERK